MPIICPACGRPDGQFAITGLSETPGRQNPEAFWCSNCDIEWQMMDEPDTTKKPAPKEPAAADPSDAIAFTERPNITIKTGAAITGRRGAS